MTFLVNKNSTGLHSFIHVAWYFVDDIKDGVFRGVFFSKTVLRFIEYVIYL